MAEIQKTDGKLESLSEVFQDEKSVVDYWKLERELAEKPVKKWRERAEKIIRRYKDERGESDEAGLFGMNRARYNILWSNVETLKPSLYARTPKVVVERRFKDSDPIGRTASQLLERALQFSISNFRFDAVMRACRDDFLLPGRGQCWVRYVPHIVQQKSENPDPVQEEEQIANQDQSLAEQPLTPRTPSEISEEVTYEEVRVDYVYWRDFLCDPARTWEEVRWVSRDVYMSRDELIKRFGEEKGNEIPLSYCPKDLKKENIPDSLTLSPFKRAVISEIWDKQTRKVYWIAKDFDKLCDVKEDPLGLRNFFPCPCPLSATTTTDSLVPVPDYLLYQDQAKELDTLTERISALMPLVRIAGAYDATKDEIKRIFTENTENALIPAKDWNPYQQSGGLKGFMDLVPIDDVANTVSTLYQIRDQVKKDLYEITGLSDIIRGNSDPRDTATAQQIKGQFATLRLADKQAEMQRFARDAIEIMGEVIAEQFSPETLALMADAEVMSDMEAATNFQAAIELLKSDVIRTFRIDIETDSTIAVNEGLEKQSRIEFLTALSQFLPQALQVYTTVPELGPAMAETLMFGVRAFKTARPLESAIEQAIKQIQESKAASANEPPAQDPQLVKVQSDFQIKQQELMIQAEKSKHEMLLKEMELQQKHELAVQDLQATYQVQLAEAKAKLQLQAEQIRTQDAANTLKALQESATESKQKEIAPTEPSKPIELNINLNQPAKKRVVISTDPITGQKVGTVEEVPNIEPPITI